MYDQLNDYRMTWSYARGFVGSAIPSGQESYVFQIPVTYTNSRESPLSTSRYWSNAVMREKSRLQYSQGIHNPLASSPGFYLAERAEYKSSGPTPNSRKMYTLPKSPIRSLHSFPHCSLPILSQLVTGPTHAHTSPILPDTPQDVSGASHTPPPTSSSPPRPTSRLPTSPEPSSLTP